MSAAVAAYPGGGETIVVDDGSRDGTAAWLGRGHPGVRVIARAANEGFGVAVNAGVAAARHQHVVLLNNDMRVEEDFLAHLLAPFGSEARSAEGEAAVQLFATTPRIVNRTYGGDEAVTACSFRYGLFETLFPERASDGIPRGAGRIDRNREGPVPVSAPVPAAPAAPVGDGCEEQGQRDHATEHSTEQSTAHTTVQATAHATVQTTEVLFACGGAAAIDRALWLALGGLDPLFAPFYWEDVDLSWRARKRGWRIVHVPDSVVHHEHGATIGARFDADNVKALYERNRLLFQWKNITSMRLTAAHLAWLAPRLARGCLGRPAFARGFAMALQRAGAAFRARRLESRMARMSDEAILARFRLRGPR